MTNLLAAMVGALVGLVGVAVGNWLQGRKEHRRWLRDQKLRAAIDFIGATGELFEHRYESPPPGRSPIDERATWVRAQDGRSALYLLCAESTREAAEALIDRVKHGEAAPDGSRDQVAIDLLRNLVKRLRAELGARG
jgi:hypothetical protein